MYCAQCGNELRPKDKFCTQCGNVVTQKQQELSQVNASALSGPAKKPASETLKKSKGKKAGIIAGSVLGGIIVIVVMAFFLLNFLNFPVMQLMGLGDEVWQYDKTIDKPISVLTAAEEDVTLGELESDGVSVYIPSQAFDSQANVSLSHPDKKPAIDQSAFVPLGAPITIKSTEGQQRLNKPIRVTLSIDTLKRDRSGALYIAELNERNNWDYIIPDEIDLQRNLVTFTTHRLGTYGFVNLKKEKLVEEFTQSRAVRQWTEHSLEDDAGRARDEIVIEILQNRLGILDESVLKKVSTSVSNDCPAGELVIALVDKESGKFTDIVAESLGKHIPKSVDPVILKEALETVTQQSWAADISGGLSQILGQGNLTQATIHVIDGVASEFIEDKVEKVWVDLADRKISIWNNQEIEKSYQVFKQGTQDQPSLWGYKVAAGDFNGLWEQMKGVVDEIVERDKDSYCRLNSKRIDELNTEEITKIREDAKARVKLQFEERLQQEAEIEKIKNRNIKLTELLNQRGLLNTEASNPLFEEQDDLASLINRVYIKIEEIKRDTGRFEVIYQADEAVETEESNPETMIDAQDLVDLVYIRYDKGEDAYKQTVADKGLIKEQKEEAKEEDVIIEVANMSLEGFWERETGLVIEIVGVNGYFQSFDSIWQEYADKDLVSKGVPKIRKIVKVDDNKWTCDNLWYHTIDDNSVVYWSNWTNIVMSDDGKSITMVSEATSPLNGTKSTSTTIYYRVTEEQSMQKPEVPEKETEDTDIGEPDIQEPAIKINLNGSWKGPYDFILKIDGSTSVFVQFSPGQQKFADLGMVKLGDLQMKDIVQINDTQWSCSVLYFFSLNNEPYSVGWSDEAIITLSEDGKSFISNSKATHPKTGKVTSGETEYTRVIQSTNI